ncbi:MAG: hypothetical protein QXN55_04855 [Candidatus Nitrosotenuis sp.]|jgi:hypothetical protein
MAKTQRFDGHNVDLGHLASKIQSYLIEHHFDVAFSHDGEFFIQAAKRGILRTTTGTRRSIDIVISGTPEYFEVKIGSGEWGNNLLVSAPLFVIPVVGIAATAVRVYSAKKLESKLWKYVKSEVGSLRNTAQFQKPRQALNQYDSDYIEGYPGWSRGVVGGKLVLERHQGAERLIFEAPDGEQITIPASKIQKASIVLGRKGLGQNDQLLEITCSDKDGNTIHPIFNLQNGLITDLLVQMNR